MSPLNLMDRQQSGLPNVHVRTAREADSLSIAEILRATGWFEYLASESVAQTADRIGNGIRAGLREPCYSLLVAEVLGGEVVGYVSVHWQTIQFLPSAEGNVSELFVSRQRNWHSPTTGRLRGSEASWLLSAEFDYQSSSRILWAPLLCEVWLGRTTTLGELCLGHSGVGAMHTPRMHAAFAPSHAGLPVAARDVAIGSPARVQQRSGLPPFDRTYSYGSAEVIAQ